MLSRKAGYIRYAEQRQEAVPADRTFSGLILRTLSVVGLICFFLLTYIALSAAKTDYGYALMNEKRQVQALQRENENLRVDIAKLEAPERIYTVATKQLGMVAPTYVLYGGQSSEPQKEAAHTGR